MVGERHPPHSTTCTHHSRVESRAQPHRASYGYNSLRWRRVVASIIPSRDVPAPLTIVRQCREIDLHDTTMMTHTVASVLMNLA
jgi:hypothetical protein